MNLKLPIIAAYKLNWTANGWFPWSWSGCIDTLTGPAWISSMACACLLLAIHRLWRVSGISSKLILLEPELKSPTSINNIKYFNVASLTHCGTFWLTIWNFDFDFPPYGGLHMAATSPLIFPCISMSKFDLFWVWKDLEIFSLIEFFWSFSHFLPLSLGKPAFEGL